MPLVTSIELLNAAEKGNYGVGAFNAINMETAQAIFEAAEEERAPFILQVTQTTLGYTEPEELVACIKALAEKSTVPMALHLDHGRSFQKVMQFLALGFTSVMIDGSLQEDGKAPRSWEENIEVTRKAVEAAHAIGVPVEGEFGMLGQIGKDLDKGSEALTDPDMAAKFVEETGIDILAVGVGTAHGLFKGTPYIDHDRLKEIDAKVKVPLVMHGSTGVADKDIQQGITEGIRKINYDTGIRVSFLESAAEEIKKIEKAWADADASGGVRKYDIRAILKPARAAMVEAVRDRMRVFMSSGKADVSGGNGRGADSAKIAEKAREAEIAKVLE
ncbi:MAG: class II fructose-bisphosphate aldolase [Armatimonadetes bacterium]|nr:class II fructose-bisphosphate aldolase [Armatimonadota bacterium]